MEESYSTNSSPRYSLTPYLILAEKWDKQNRQSPRSIRNEMQPNICVGLHPSVLLLKRLAMYQRGTFELLYFFCTLQTGCTRSNMKSFSHGVLDIIKGTQHASCKTLHGCLCLFFSRRRHHQVHHGLPHGFSDIHVRFSIAIVMTIRSPSLGQGM